MIQLEPRGRGGDCPSAPATMAARAVGFGAIRRPAGARSTAFPRSDIVAAIVSTKPSPTASATPGEQPKADVGPDPVYGVALGVLGLMMMAVGGAATFHYVFNVGEGLMLLGAVVFLGCAVVTHFKQSGPPTVAGIRDGLLKSIRSLRGKS